MRYKAMVRKLIAAGCAAAMAASTCGVGAAYAWQTQSYDIPTQETPLVNADGARYATAVGQHGSAVVGEYAGLSEQVNEIYATPGNGVSTSNYMYNPYFGIFGSSANENPDPYTANLFYNWYVQANNMTDGAAQLQKSDNAMVNFLFASSKGSSIAKDTSDSGTGTCITLAGRPDVLTLHSTGLGAFDAQIKAINDESPSSQYYKAESDTYVGDKNYKPLEVTYAEDNCGTQIDNMWGHAKAAAQVEADAKAAGKKVVTRYGDSLETAQKYELYTKGSVLYTLSKIADGTIQKKTVAYVKGINGNTVTLYSEPDPAISREMAHHIECTVATANNLANVLHPELERQNKMQEVTCTVADLAKADVILLADPDNMAYNFSPMKDGKMVKPTWTKHSSPSAEDNYGKEGTRDDGAGHFKNQFYGPQAATNTMVSTIKEALLDLGTPEAKALAKKNIMSCVQEGSSSSDGGSIEAMSQYGIINAFIYPEIASGVNQYGWYLDNIAHIKTSKVAKMVRILSHDMSLADGASLADVNDYDAATSDAITATYEDGMRYYLANKSKIDNLYPWLTPTDNMAMPAAKAQTISVKTTVGKTYGDKSFNLGAKAQTKLTYKSSNTKVATVSSEGVVTIKGAGTAKITVSAAGNAAWKAASKTVTVKVAKKAQTLTVSTAKKTAAKGKYTTAIAVKGAKGTKSFKKVSGSKFLTVTTTGKVKVSAKAKKGATYSVKVKVTAKETANYKAAAKTATVKVKVK
ncbi:MAG: hypothetical protein Q4D06_06545 [Coriobacteriia bacterium]|nr:hypothetical protein [Coriobacteriia bacterium]